MDQRYSDRLCNGTTSGLVAVENNRGGCLYYEASSAGKYPYKMGSQSTTLAEDATTFLGAHEL